MSAEHHGGGHGEPSIMATLVKCFFPVEPMGNVLTESIPPVVHTIFSAVGAGQPEGGDHGGHH